MSHRTTALLQLTPATSVLLFYLCLALSPGNKIRFASVYLQKLIEITLCRIDVKLYGLLKSEYLVLVQ